MTELEPRDPRRTYRSRGRPAVDAVRGMGLAPHSGAPLGLLGPSGCGKSTTPTDDRRPVPAADDGGEPGLGPKARRGQDREDVDRKVAEITERLVLTGTLAEGIAVLDDGVIQQPGTPYEIYYSPANGLGADSAAGAGGQGPRGRGRRTPGGPAPHRREGMPAKGVAHEPLLEAGIATLATRRAGPCHRRSRPHPCLRRRDRSSPR